MAVVSVIIMSKYADIEHALDYLVPADLNPVVGQVVDVPLGKRTVQGIVIDRGSKTEVSNIKEVSRLHPTILPTELVTLAPWLARRAGCSVAAAFSAMFFHHSSGKPLKRWQVDGEALATAQLTEKQHRVASWLSQRQPLLKSEIIKGLGVSTVPIDNLIAKGVLVGSVVAAGKDWPLQPIEQLTASQSQVVTAIEKSTSKFKDGGEFLLHGVTGSGKTEIYIRIAEKIIAQGRQVLVLVPEIALTAQLVARFQAAFGQKVSVQHSGLNNNSRAADWRKVRQGEINIVIGTRSAVFAPFANLGLIIMDEEHEPAYKQEETPRYHARDVVLFRGRWHKAIVLLGSATPSLESYARAQAGRYNLLTLPQRIHVGAPVDIKLVDMRQELAHGNRDMFSRELLADIRHALSCKQQVLLFLNRRGVAPTVLCRSCGFRYSCSNCSTALTLHQHGQLRCHHCGVSTPISKVCPQCGSQFLRPLGLGTQKLENRLQALFPRVKILRLDGDTAANAQHKENQLFEFYKQKASILLGTQMIAKGLDFPNVTLVGIVLADLSLGISDFRAAERTFQLITQAAGRTGRATKPGKVVIQTYQPEHYSMKYALTGDYQGFFHHELKIRASTSMPPYSGITRILVSSPHQDRMLRRVETIGPLLSHEVWELVYSGPPPLEKLKGRHRWQFLLRHRGDGKAWEQVDILRRSLPVDKHSRTVFDNNPYNFM